MADNISRSKPKYILTLIVSTALLAAIVVLADTGKILNTVKSVDPSYFLLAVLAGNIPILLNARIWQNTMEFLGNRKNYWETVRMLYGFSFINNVTPFGNIGGEPIIAYRVSKNVDKDYQTVLSSVFFTGLVIFLPMIALLPLASAYLGLYSGISSFWILSPVASLILSFFLLKNFKLNRISLLKRIESRLEVTGKAEKIRDGFSIYEGDRTKLITALGLSSTGMFFDVLCLSILVFAVSGNTNFLVLLAIVPVARLSNFAPSPGGSGFYEAGLTGLLGVFTSLNAAEAVSVALLYRLSTFYIGIIAGYVELNIWQKNQR